jgi:hypothetical protein
MLQLQVRPMIQGEDLLNQNLSSGIAQLCHPIAGKQYLKKRLKMISLKPWHLN